MLYVGQYQNEEDESNYQKVGKTWDLDLRMTQLYSQLSGLAQYWWGVNSVTHTHSYHDSNRKGLCDDRLETAVKAAFSKWMYPVPYRNHDSSCHEVFKDIPDDEWCRVMATASRLAKKAKDINYCDSVSYFFDEMGNTPKDAMAIQHNKIKAFREYTKQGMYRINQHGRCAVGQTSATRYPELPEFENQKWEKIVAA